MSSGSEVEELLAPFAHAAIPSGPRFVDVPSDVAVRVLDSVGPAIADSRPNGDQPSMRWLVAAAGELDGRLAGSLSWGDLRFDAVQVQGRPAWSALLERLARDWSAEATTSAGAELWTGWDAVQPYWVGQASAALAAARSGGDVLGLWWD